MLYPRENEARGLISLAGIWDFKLGDDAEPGERLTRPEAMEPIAVPASYNDQKDVPDYRNHYGFACPLRWRSPTSCLREARRSCSSRWTTA